jgi:hypothetical protein
MIPNVPELSELSHDVIGGLIRIDGLNSNVVLDAIASSRDSALDATRAACGWHGVDIDTASRNIQLTR